MKTKKTQGRTRNPEDDQELRLPSSALRVPHSGLVYVVDDDPSVRRGLSRLLRSAGYRVETFESAREFLECGMRNERARAVGNPESANARDRESPIRNPKLECLILDVQMPGLNGLELQEALGGAGQGLPIIFITGHGDIPTSVQAMKKGAVDFLSKPFDEQVLLDAIKEALERDQSTRGQREENAGTRKRMATLTPREREVMKGVVAGRLNKQIAGDLGIAEKTVKVHRGRVMAKMGVQSVAELVRMSENAERGMQSAEG